MLAVLAGCRPWPSDLPGCPNQETPEDAPLYGEANALDFMQLVDGLRIRFDDDLPVEDVVFDTDSVDSASRFDDREASCTKAGGSATLLGTAEFGFRRDTQAVRVFLSGSLGTTESTDGWSLRLSGVERDPMLPASPEFVQWLDGFILDAGIEPPFRAEPVTWELLADFDDEGSTNRSEALFRTGFVRNGRLNRMPGEDFEHLREQLTHDVQLQWAGDAPWERFPRP